jgi:uncharacterized protein YpmB
VVQKGKRMMNLRESSHRNIYYAIIVAGIIVLIYLFSLSFGKSQSKPVDIDRRETIDKIAGWYQTYGSELVSMHAAADKYCAIEGVQCLSDKLEIELTYMRVRAAKPKVLWEVSPSHGYSTLWLAAAIAKNKNGGTLLSFDLTNRIKKAERPEWKTKANWQLVLGDFKAKFQTYLNQYSTPDYLFLDSFHSADFGRFYIEEVFPKLTQLKPHLFISLHDVYNPSFWTDGSNVNLRKEAKLPDWMANEEGQVVLGWLAFHPQSHCCLFTVAPSHDSKFTKSVISIRKQHLSGFTQMKSDYHWHDDNFVFNQNNPTIYFELLSRS